MSKKELTVNSLMMAIKAKCLECCGGSWNYCKVDCNIDCPLKPFHDWLDWSNRTKQPALKR